MLFIWSDLYSAFLFQVQSSLAANFLSSLSALVGFILLSVNLALLGPALQKCDLDKEKLLSEWQTSNHNFYQNEMNCLIANDTLAVSIFWWDPPISWGFLKTWLLVIPSFENLSDSFWCGHFGEGQGSIKERLHDWDEGGRPCHCPL